MADTRPGEDEPGLVNAVLDAVAREAREGELEAKRTAKPAPRRAGKVR